MSDALFEDDEPLRIAVADIVGMCHGIEQGADVYQHILAEIGSGRMRSVGQLEDAVMEDVAFNLKGARCAGAMAFFRLRRQLEQLGAPPRLRPSSLSADASTVTPRMLSERLASEHQLFNFHEQPNHEGVVAAGAFLLGLTLLLYGIFHPQIWLIVAGLAGLVTAWCARRSRLDYSRFPKGQTLGDMAHHIARNNMSRLSEIGARFRPEDAIALSRQILAERAKTSPDEIYRGARLLD